MKSLKKLTSLLIALAMLVSMFTTVAFAQDIKFSDVAEDHPFYQAIYTLVNRGVLNGYEDGTFKPDNTITRAEFAKVIMVSEIGDANIPANTTSKFSDTGSHWANKYIAAAVNAGIINGYPDGTFKPDNTVTYAEAVKMAVCALGYGPVIDTNLNPWYQGYIKQASSIGLTKGAVAMGDSGASRGIVAQLINNMKDCKRLVQTGTDASGKPIFNTSTGGNDSMFSDDEYTDGYGVLVGVYENSLIGSDSTLTKSQVQIDNAVYTLDEGVNYESLERYIGYSVDYRIRRTSGNRIFVSDIISNNATKIEELDAYDIDYYSNGKLYYFADIDHEEETEEYKIDDNLYVVYNGYGVPSKYIDSAFIKDIFDMDAGSVKLYNNDGDAAFDVAFVDKYETYFVNTVSKNTKEGTVTITDKLGFQPKIVFDEDDTIAYKITKAGNDPEDAKITDIASKNVVSVAQPHESAPADIPTTIVISKAYVSGSVDSMVGDYDIIEVKSDDYVLAPCFRDFLALSGNEDTYGFDVGSTVKFFLDFTGKIVCTDVTETSASYGYLIDYLPGTGMDSEIEVRLLTSAGTVKEYVLAKDVTINGESKSASTAITMLQDSSRVINKNKDSDYKVEDGSVEQLITYELGTQSGNQVIKKIGTVGTGTDGQVVPYAFTYHSSEDKKEFADCGSSAEKNLYAKSTSTFKSQDGKIQFTADSSTIVFYVPYGRTDIDDYKKYTKSKFLDDYYFVEPYDVDGLTAEVIVWYGDDGDDLASINAASPTVFVNAIDRGRDNDGKEIYVLTYTTVGSDTEKTANVETKSVLSGIEVGDIIKIALSGDQLDKAALVYDESKGELYDFVTGKVVSDGYVATKYNGDDIYYQAHCGVIFDMPESGEGSIGVGENDEVVQSYQLNSSTKYYKLETSGRTTELSSDYTYESIVSYSDDAAGATRVVIVAIGTKVTGVYILD